MQHEELCRIEGTSLKFLEIPLSTIYEIIMGTANITCKLTNLGKFKCYTKSGSKIVYEDDGLNKLQSFIIFPNKTTLSTGECEYTIGLTGQLEYQHPWVDWTYTVPSNAIKGTTYSYTMTGSAFGLSNYKGAIVFGVPSKTWSWDLPNYYIKIFPEIKTYLSGDTPHRDFYLAVTYMLPSSTSIIVKGTLSYKIIIPETGMETTDQYVLNKTCTSINFNNILVSSSSGRNLREYKTISWSNTSTSTNSIGVNAEFSI